MKKSLWSLNDATMLVAVLCLCSGVTAIVDPLESEGSTCPSVPFPSVPDWVRYGGFLLLILASLMSLWGMAHICEDYFCPALHVFCVRWNVPDSVAGSLVMAAGNDVAELAISFFGIFVQKNAIGIGTIVGSQLFNHMCIFAGSCLYAKDGVLQLNGRHLTRDTFGYFLALILLLWAVGAQPKNMLKPSAWTTECLDVPFWRACVLLICQVIYCLVVANFEKISQTLYIRDFVVNVTQDLPKTSSSLAEEDIELHRVTVENNSSSSSTSSTADDHLGELSTNEERHTASIFGTEVVLPMWMVPFINPFSRFCTIILHPLKTAARYSIPSPYKLEHEHLYGMTVVACTVWFAVYAFILCECLDMLGHFFEIPSVIMGLTFSAVGTSFPNLWSSLVVAQSGKGDMAVSNAMGSNTFNIFLALGLPWFCYTAIYGDYRSIQDGGITDLTMILLILLIVVYIIIMLHGWRLYDWYVIKQQPDMSAVGVSYVCPVCTVGWRNTSLGYTWLSSDLFAVFSCLNENVITLMLAQLMNSPSICSCALATIINIHC